MKITPNLSQYEWQPAVIQGLVNTPPSNPLAGDRYVIGSSPTGVWSGHALEITQYYNGAWMFSIPAKGWIVPDNNTGKYMRFTGTVWVYTTLGQGRYSVNIAFNSAYRSSWGVENVPYYETISSSFVLIHSMPFKGTDSLLNIESISATVCAPSGGNTEWRIYDPSAGNVISSGSTPSSSMVISQGSTPVNVPSGQALLEVQIRNDAGNEARISGVEVVFNVG